MMGNAIRNPVWGGSLKRIKENNTPKKGERARNNPVLAVPRERRARRKKTLAIPPKLKKPTTR
jgi:hypothetical protein